MFTVLVLGGGSDTSKDCEDLKKKLEGLLRNTGDCKRTAETDDQRKGSTDKLPGCKNVTYLEELSGYKAKSKK
uniref:Uncharacterized protein n=1 Tax=Trichobilharzia regenti TaxID=157069 RepID=A0AA85ITB9_TRIRE|nr:unnamed protein product [Trichobilharzia regenti]